MKPAPFDYHRAATADEAADLLARTGGKVLAGGQSLVPLMSMRLASPAALVDINRAVGLDDVEIGGEGIRVGATVRHRRLENDEAVFAANPLLRQALRHVAHPTIRNRGTTVGSLVHADPAAEMPAVLSLLDGVVEVVGPGGVRRSIPAAELVVGPLESSLRHAEVAVAAVFPALEPRTGSSWHEVSRRAGDYALAGVGAVVTVDDAGAVASARVALISVAPVPVVVAAPPPGRASNDVGSVDWSEVVDAVDRAIDPEDDLHASAAYRRRLASVLTRRALTGALGAARDRASVGR